MFTIFDLFKARKSTSAEEKLIFDFIEEYLNKNPQHKNWMNKIDYKSYSFRFFKSDDDDVLGAWSFLFQKTIFLRDYHSYLSYIISEKDISENSRIGYNTLATSRRCY